VFPSPDNAAIERCLRQRTDSTAVNSELAHTLWFLALRVMARFTGKPVHVLYDSGHVGLIRCLLNPPPNPCVASGTPILVRRSQLFQFCAILPSLDDLDDTSSTDTETSSGSDSEDHDSKAVAAANISAIRSK
jgi:hypothetical protein